MGKTKLYTDKLIFALNLLFSISYILWRIFFTVPIGYGLLSSVAGILLLCVEVLGFFEAIIHYRSMYYYDDFKLPDASAEEYPDVDVFVVTYNESPELVYKTINGCCHMDYPQKEKVHIYLCDDGNRKEMDDLARSFGIHYLFRTNREGAKAGNLNHALRNSDSPYIVTFDADMIPRSNFLMKTMPYFIDAERKNSFKKQSTRIDLGFVQSPQSFYNPDVFQFNFYSEERIPNEQDYFYQDIQIARTRSNSVIYGGSNTVLSRAALEAVGGFYTDSITEDFATGILIQKAGFVSLAIREPLASGLSVTDMTTLIRQRVRWARGVIQSGRKLHILASRKLSARQKLNYWASVWYWYAPIKRLVYIMCPILYAAFDILVIRCTLQEVLIFWLPMYISSNMVLRTLSRNIRNTRWTGVYETALFPFMLLPVLLETAGISMKTFHVSDKHTETGRNRRDALYMLPFALLLCLSVFGIAKCIIEMFETNSIQPVVVLFWLVGNMYYLVMALFFVDGREIRRTEHRLHAQCDVIISTENESFCAAAVNLSDSGIAVSINKPVYISPNSVAVLRIKDRQYEAEIKASIVYVNQLDNKWIYAFHICDYCRNKNEYFQIVYDRIPGLPKTLQGASGGFDDLLVNGAGRGSAPSFQRRKLPRIVLSQKLSCPQSISGKVLVEDYNFRYFRVGNSRYLPEEIEITYEDGATITGRKCKLRRNVYEIIQPDYLEASEIIIRHCAEKQMI